MQPDTFLYTNLLEPISAEQPAGEDLSDVGVFAEIEMARRSDDPEADWVGGRRDLKKADWPAAHKVAAEALEKRSKDLRLAIFLLEADLHLRGLQGLCDGAKLIRELLLRFWDKGLYPLPEDDGDLENRATPLAWLGEKLAEFITRLAHNAASRREVAHTEVLENARKEFLGLREVMADKFKHDAPSLNESLEALARCVAPAEAPAPVPEVPLTTGVGAPPRRCSEPVLLRPEPELATSQVSGEGGGGGERARFVRKLRLAEDCLGSGRQELARIVLEELAGQLEEKLVSWEGPRLTGLVWRQLYRCYRDGGDKQKAEEVYLRICKLDPWQAIECEQRDR
jgi:hypothetical protein